jgi:hypothetical protein
MIFLFQVTAYLFISLFLHDFSHMIFLKGRQSPGIGISYGEHHVKIKRWKGRQSPGIGISYREHHVKVKRWKGRQSPGVEISYGEHHVKIKRWKGRLWYSYSRWLPTFSSLYFYMMFPIWYSYSRWLPTFSSLYFTGTSCKNKEMKR